MKVFGGGFLLRAPLAINSSGIESRGVDLFKTSKIIQKYFVITEKINLKMLFFGTKITKITESMLSLTALTKEITRYILNTLYISVVRLSAKSHSSGTQIDTVIR